MEKRNLTQWESFVKSTGNINRKNLVQDRKNIENDQKNLVHDQKNIENDRKNHENDREIYADIKENGKKKKIDEIYIQQNIAKEIDLPRVKNKKVTKIISLLPFSLSHSL